MDGPFAPNSGAAESQTHNEKPQKGLDSSNNVSSQQDDILASQACPAPDGNHYSQHYQSNSTVWALYLKETEADDKELSQLWQTGLDQLLIFAGLFGAILTAFLIESRKDLKEDPLEAILVAIRNESPEPFRPHGFTLVVNAAWFCSLCLTLISALAAVLAKGWLAKYTPATAGIRSYDACERHLRYLRAQQWRLGTIVGGIPILIQIALFLFAVGLVIFILDDNFGIGMTLLVLTILATVLYAICTFLPWFSPACPFQTTMSDFIPGMAMNARYSSKKGSPTLPKPLAQQWKGFTNFLRETHRKPEQLEIEADILAWLLTNSTTEEALDGAVKAIAGANGNQFIPSALDEYDANSVLTERLSQCLKIVPGLPTTIVDERRAEACLHAILRTMEPFSRPDQNKVLLVTNSVEPGQPLYQWDAYTDYLQPLAFAVRTKVLLFTGRDENSIERERTEVDLGKMAGRGMTLYVRWVLLNAAVEGLFKGKMEVRKISGQVLGKLLQVSDTINMLGEGGLADKVILAMVETFKESGDTDFLEVLMRIARCSKFRPSIGVIISEIVSLLKHSEWEIRMAGASALSKLSEQTELRRSIETATLDVVKFLRDSDAKIRLATTEALSELSQRAEFQPSIVAAIPEIVILLKDNDMDVCKACATALSKFSEQGQFRTLINPALLDMVKLFNDGDNNVRVAYSDALAKLSQQAAEFRPLIGPIIPEIVKLLQDSGSSIRMKCVEALSTFSEHAEFRSLISPAIPGIVDLLKDDDLNVRQGAVGALTKLSGQAEFRPWIGIALVEIVDLLKGSDSSVRLACMKALSILSEDADFRNSIHTSVPQIIQLVDEDDWNVSRGALNALLTLSDHAELRPSIGTAIPGILRIFTDCTSWSLQANASLVLKLTQQAEFRPLLRPAIPEIVKLLRKDAWFAVSAGAEALSHLSAHTEFHPLIGPTIPVILDLVKNGNGLFRWVYVDTLKNFSQQAELRHLIGPSIPIIVNLLKDTELSVRQACAGALSGLLLQAEYRDAIENAIWSTQLSQRPLRNLRDRPDNSSSHLAFGHSSLKLKASDMDRVSSIDRADLMRYWSVDDRFHTFDGVCILADLADVAQMCDNQIIAYLFTTGGDGHLPSLLNIVLKLNKNAEYRQSIHTAIPDIFNILKNSNDLDIRRQCADALSKLSEEDAVRPLIKTIIPNIVNLVKEGEGETCQVLAYTLVKLSVQAEFRPLIAPAIPGIVNSLKDSDWGIYIACAEVLSTLSEQAELRPLIEHLIVKSLQGSESGVRRTGAVALLKVSEQVEFRPLIAAAIPEIIDLLKDSDEDVRQAGAYTLSELSKRTEYQPLIDAAIPEILDLFNVGDRTNLLAGATALSVLSKHIEFQSIGTVIPQIINLLKHSDRDVCRAGADALSEFSEEAKYRSLIGSAVSEILDLFNVGDKVYLLAGATALSILSKHMEFQPLIVNIIPEIIGLITDRDDSVRMACVDALSNLSAQAEFLPLISPAIAGIINSLDGNDSTTCKACVSTLSILSQKVELRRFIDPAIPGIINLFKDNKCDWRLRLEISFALSAFLEHAEFRPSIGSSLSGIIDLLKDDNGTVYWEYPYAFFAILDQAEFRHLIGSAIPEIVNLLKHNDKYIREVGADALLRLSKQDYCVQEGFPIILHILLSSGEESEATVSICARIFASHAFNDFFRDKIVRILTCTFHYLYLPDGSRRARAFEVIEVLAEYVTFAPILHEIWAIYSFARNVLSITRLEDIKFFVEQMHTYGLLKSI